MERHSIQPRAGWQSIVESSGLIWHSDGTDPYWDESAYYEFSLAEIERIERAAEELHGLFVKAGDWIVSHPETLSWLGVPEYCHEAILKSWDSEPPALNYGRFDLGFDGRGEPKLFEYNCDTPTSMLEAGVVQWQWKEDCFPDLDQFTSLHEKLIARWSEIAPAIPNRRVWFAHVDDPSHEDAVTTTYMSDLAQQAGLETRGVLIDDIGLDPQGRIVDHEDWLITSLFKLYPWEWIVDEAYGPDIVRHLPETFWIEPIWKMMWSNKGILAILWRLFPGHPNLLPASTDPAEVGDSYVAKPFLAREGANIQVMERGRSIAESSGPYEGEPMLYQQLYPLRNFGNGYPVLGAWMVNGQAAGLGIREDGRITGNRARFVPHVISG